MKTLVWTAYRNRTESVWQICIQGIGSFRVFYYGNACRTPAFALAKAAPEPLVAIGLRAIQKRLPPREGALRPPKVRRDPNVVGDGVTGWNVGWALQKKLFWIHS